MRHRTKLILAVVLVVAPARAIAWEAPPMWWDPADGPSPGGGGIFGTGGTHDHGITCANCHVERDARGEIRLDLSFTPSLGSAGGVATYEPGRTYAVEASLVGELLTGPCGPYASNVNNFAASFEDPTGRATGVLVSDSGQSQASCPDDPPSRDDPGTTALYRDCEVVFSRGAADRARWSFSWTAPPAGTGTVRISWGAVDGNCDMASMRDAATAGTLDLAEALAARAAPRPRPDARWALAGVLPVLAGLWIRTRRRP